MEEYGRHCKNPTDADTLIQLALDYIEHEQNIKVSRSYAILPESTTHKGELEFVRLSITKRLKKQDDQYEKDMSEIEKTFGPIADSERDSLLSKLSNMTTSDKKKNNKNVDLNKAANGYSINIPNAPKQPIKKGLIEEIGSSNVSSKRCPTPKYSLEPCEQDGCHCLELRVELPGVTSVGECELDISEDDVQLVVPDRFDLKVKLPSCIDDDRAQAKFRKKTSLLTLIMPVKT